MTAAGPGANHTLYQVSTATALVQGIYQGAVSVGTLREHGDLGLGTFENLDGEMVIVDGHFFQVPSDGSVRECTGDALSPFAVITRFAPDAGVALKECPDLSHLPRGSMRSGIPATCSSRSGSTGTSTTCTRERCAGPGRA